MKISCQSCHSRYNVADEKIQGRIVKIRCRKCGTTIVVNASGVAPANGSATAAPATPPSTGNTASAGGDPGEWHVSVADNDQRTMTLEELVIAYNTGVITADTFIWTDGMQDWKLLAEVDAVVSALHAAAASQPAPAAVGGYGLGAAAQVATSPSYEPAAPQRAHSRPAATYGGGFVAQAAAATESKRAAVVKREARARDLFATRTGEELHGVATTHEGDDAKLTGQRNENSVLFSLQHLTKSAEERSTEARSATETDDSGVIDLNALAARAESMRPTAMPDPNVASPLGFVPSPFGSPLGSHGPLGFETPQRSRLPLLIAGGVGIAMLLVVGIVIGMKLGGVAPGTGAAASVPAFPFPSTMPSATAEPSAASSAGATAQASASASSAPVAAKTHAYGGGGTAWHGGGAGAKPAAGGAPAGGGTGAAGGTGAGGTAGAAAGGGAASPTPAAPKKNDCGCNGDLMCLMKCSTH